MTQLATVLEAEPSRVTERRAPLSSTLWGIDWNDWLPWRVTEDGITAHVSSYEESLPFLQKHYGEIFQDDGSSPFRALSLSEPKERYYRAVGDFFEFRHGGVAVALLVCNPSDWGSYYIRSCGVIPEYQSRGIMQRFVPRIFEALREHGVERVEADTAPSNLPVLHILSRLRFNVTGTNLTDRWGAQLRLTKFLVDENRTFFLNQFCSGVLYQ
jgi:RimJ/RimL family protein N-acetyltransferase